MSAIKFILHMNDDTVRVLSFDIDKIMDIDTALLKKILNTAKYYNPDFIATYRNVTQEECEALKEVLEYGK